MSLESEDEWEGMRRVGDVVARTLRALKRAVRPGITTAALDAIAAGELAKRGARPAPRLVYGFPGAACISVNDEVTHGVPGKRILRRGDLVKLDVTAELDGYMADSAISVVVPPVSPLHRGLCACADSALAKAIAIARTGTPINEIGWTIQREVENHGFHILRDLSGHGIGRTIHEEPRAIPNYYDPALGMGLTDGLVIAIEPLISASTESIREAGDGWTVKTADRSLSAHAEHTIAISGAGCRILTA